MCEPRFQQRQASAADNTGIMGGFWTVPVIMAAMSWQRRADGARWRSQRWEMADGEV
jgi:hypothetical protein